MDMVGGSTKKMQHAQKHERLPLIVISIISLFGSLLLFGSSLHGTFVYDDAAIMERKDLRQISAVWTTVWSQRTNAGGTVNEGYRPLSMAMYALQYSIFGDNPFSFHLFNILLHALTTISVYLLVVALFKQQPLAFFSALLFLFLPIHSENVSAIRYREDILSAFYMIWSWLAFLKAQEVQKRQWLWYSISGVLYLGCLLSKELLLFSPIIIWIISLKHSAVQRSTARCAVVFGTGLAVYIGLRMMVYGIHGVDVTVSQPPFNPLIGTDALTHIATTGKIFLTYVAKSFIPLNLSVTYSFNHFPVVSHPFASWESLIGLLLIGVMLFVAVRYRQTPAGVGTVIFLVSFIMVSKLLLRSADIFAERWMYFPSIGLIIPAAWFLSREYKKYPGMVIGLLLFVLGWYAVIDVERSAIWKNSMTLYQSMITDAPESAWAHYSMANYLLTLGKVEEAEKEALVSYAISPQLYESVELLGQVAGYKQDYEMAGTYFQAAIKLNTDNPVAHLNYALVLSKQKRYNESIDYLSDLLAKRPTDMRVRYVMALNLYKLGSYNEAEKFFDWDNSTPIDQKISQLEAF